MSRTYNALAFDLGAESGRAMLARFDGERITLAEAHRFANGGVRVRDSLHWDVLRLWVEIQRGLALAAPHGLHSIGIDTWGVDFALLDADDALIGHPFHYRDRRTDGMVEEACRRVPRAEIFAQTGVQFIQINSLYQLLALARAQSAALANARTLLMIPDLFNFWLTSRKVSEFSIASTTQCYDPRAGGWARDLMERLGIPAHIFAEIVPPGTELGPLAPELAAEHGLLGLRVIAPACHDTASAVAAVPAAGDDFAYISSGTWSLMGIECDAPIITAQSLAHNFTNEGGAGGAFRFLKNIMGLWLVQACRRAWQSEGETLAYDDLMTLAAGAPALVSLIDPDDARFLHPINMPAAIRNFCAQSGQPAPLERGAVVRCALESLALRYRWTLERIAEMRGRKPSVIHIVGGGSQNRLLCQWTADACAVPVVAGPVEATALGNALVQLMSAGKLASLREGRELVRHSFAPQTYQPRPSAAWDDAYGRWLAMQGHI
ncbi:MAG: rhamnulokinase [Chloroflexi bacterium]|nr:rhamnulokinase [Chloroflexota bacterium]